MFRQKVVFVVGAGASCEIGLPSGKQLKDYIQSALNLRFDFGQQVSGDARVGNAIIRHASEHNRRRIDNYLNACQLIIDALPPSISIDNLLDAHSGDELIELCGKIGIVHSIWKSEAESKLQKSISNKRLNLGAVADTWLTTFFQMLSEGVRRSNIDSLFDNVYVISFNYDRCIEVFLIYAIQSYYNVSHEEAISCVARLKIIHPYGSVGSILTGEAGFVPFGGDKYSLLETSRRIKTFSEGMKSKSYGDVLKEAIQSSEKVVFLGFAFHPINMDILSVEGAPNMKQVFGTTFEMGEPAVNVIRSDIMRIFNKKIRSDKKSSLTNINSLDQINLSPEKSYNFLSMYFRAIV